MPTTSKLRKTGEKLTAAEARLTERVTPREGTVQERLVTQVGKLGDQPELRTISGAVMAAGLLTANRRLVRAGVRMLLAHELATLAKDIIKERVDRTRPRTAKSHSERKPRLGRHTAKDKTSFPSGHSAGAVAVAWAFSREYPELQGAALAAAGLIAAAQVPRLAHYPTDVAGGLLLGTASEAAAHAIVGPAVSEEDPAKP